jgi:DNA segregation ATPase FtsK/SpoIIIE-like protein
VSEIKGLKQVNIDHILSKKIYRMHKKFLKKIKAIGLFTSIALLFALSQIIKTIILGQFSFNIETHIVMVIFIISYSLITLASKDKLREYYLIKAFECKFMSTTEKMILEDIRYLQNGNVQYHFSTNVTLMNFIKNKDKLEIIFKDDIINIKNYPNNNNMICITTGSKIDRYNLAKNSLNLSERVESIFSILGFSIVIRDIKESKYNSVINFDCRGVESKKIINCIEEFKHVSNLEDVDIESNTDTDYKLTINKIIDTIDFKDMLMKTKLTKKKNLIVGLNKKGDLIILDIHKIYHAIIAGTTGGGKSNLAHVIISSLIASSLDIAFFLLDPKKSELKRYRDINRVMYTGESMEILETLRGLKDEMVRRNSMFEKDKFVNDIESYNLENPGNKLPYIFIYIEEIAFLLLNNKDELREEFKDLIISLTSAGRSAGFRIMLSTQKPNADILSTLIKTNCKTRFGFSVANANESKVILDNNLCKDLKEAGDMILQNLGVDSKVKVPYLKPIDVKNIVYYLEDEFNNPTDYKNSEEIVRKLRAVSKNKSKDIKDFDIKLDKNDKTVVNKPILNLSKNIITIGKYEVNNSNDLLDIYLQLVDPENKVPSLNKTCDLVTCGRTTIQEYRKQLESKGFLRITKQYCYLTKKALNKKALMVK